MKALVMRPRDDGTLDVWLIGRGGNYLHSLHHLDSDAHRALLLRANETRFPLYFLINGPHIVAVADLSAEQYEALARHGRYPQHSHPWCGCASFGRKPLAKRPGESEDK